MIEKICIILLVNILFFFKTIGYKYVSDDIPSFLHNPPVKNKWHRIFLQLRGSYKRVPQEDHFITLMIHAIVCVFIYLAFGKTDVSFLAAILFSFNPINNQGSVWISGRGYVLSTLFILMTLAIPAMGIIFLLWATYFNVGYIAPIVLLGSNAWWLMFAMPFIWAHRLKKFKGDIHNKVTTEMFKEDKDIKPEKLILGVKTFGFYLTHSIIPVKTTFYHSFLQSAAGCGKDKAYSWKDRFFWLGLIYLCAIFYYWFTQPWSMISFGLFWWCVGIAPFCNLMRMSQEIAERYVYFPNAGLMVVLASLINGHPALCAGFVMMYATKMWFYMDSYQDDYYIIENSCMHSPQSWFAWHVRAMKRWETKSYQEAIILWVMARMISPKEFKLLFNLATGLMVARQKDEALKFLAEAEKNIPGGQEKECMKLIEDFKKGECAIIL